MRTLAEGVHGLAGRPPNAIKVYLVGDVLVDAGTPAAKRRILRQLAGREVRTHLVTRAHSDHFGSSHAVWEALGLPLWTGVADAEAIETASPVPARGRVPALMAKMKMAPPHAVARRLQEGDEVAGLVVRDAPGHIALSRESQRTLVCGDVFFNMPSLRPPPRLLTYDPEQNRASMRRLAELRPARAVRPRSAAARSGAFGGRRAVASRRRWPATTRTA